MKKVIEKRDVITFNEDNSEAISQCLTQSDGRKFITSISQFHTHKVIFGFVYFREIFRCKKAGLSQTFKA